MEFPSLFSLRSCRLTNFASVLACGLLTLAGLKSASAQATLYWDSNSTTLGSGSATGTWGTSAFWSTDATGASATANTPTTNADDLFFSAGTNGTAGTVTVLTTQSAHSLTFDDPVAITVSGGTAINLGNAAAGSGLFFNANGATTISTAIILNSVATALNFTNSGTSLQTISGAITGSAAAGTQTLTLGTASTGALTLGGIIGNGAGGGNVALNVNSSGNGITSLNGVNTFTGGFTLTAGTVNLSQVNSAGVGAMTINGGTLESYSTTSRTLGVTSSALNGDFSFGTSVASQQVVNGVVGTRTLNLGTGAVTLGGNRTITVNTNTALAPRASAANYNQLIIGGVVGGGAVSLTKAGPGTLSLASTANTFSGGVNVTGGALRLAGDGSAITTNNITLNGGVIEFAYAPAATYTLGTGVGQINLTGGGGFSAASSGRSVTLAGGTMVWGTTANFVGAGNVLKFGSVTADNSLTLTNAIDLGATTRTIDVTRGTNANVVDGVISGNVTNGSLTKTGNGSLRLSAAGTALTGTTTVSGGTLILANEVAALANTNVSLNGGVLGVNANFTAALGTSNGQVSFAGGSASGGFSAFGGDRTINIGGAGATLTWNSTPNFLGTGALILSSSSSNNATILANSLDFNGADRTIQVEEGNAGDDARITGIISGAGSLIKTGGQLSGGGRLVLSGANTYTGQTVIRNGEVYINNSVLNNTVSPLGNSSSAIVLGDSTSLTSDSNNNYWLGLLVRGSNAAGAATSLGDSQQFRIERPIDISQTNSNVQLGRTRIGLLGNVGVGTDTSRLTLAGDITMNNRSLELYVERNAQTLEVAGNITGTGTIFLTGAVNANPSGTDGRSNGNFRFTNVARPYSSSMSLTFGTLLIEGSVAAAGNSPIGTQTLSLGDGNGGNILNNSNGRDAVRSVFLETPGATFARALSAGGGSSVTPSAGAQATLYGTGGSNLLNGYRFGGVNSSGTVTYSGLINPGGVATSVTGTAAGLGGTNPVTVVHNIALMAATGGTVDFTNTISGSTAVPLGATGTPGGASSTGNMTRITINQFRNHPNLDANIDGLADAVANALVGTATNGTVVMSGTNSYGASTEILGGTLRLNYATLNTTKLADAAALLLSGGTVELAGGSHTEVVGSTAIATNTANNINRASGTGVLRLNAITRSAGGLLNFGAGSIADTDTNNNANGILGTYATIAGIDWATSVNSGAADTLITALSTYTDVTRLNSGPQIITDGPTTNVRITEGTGSAADIALSAATTTINTLNQGIVGGTSAATIDPAGQILAVDGVLLGTGAGGLTIGNGTNNGFVNAATAGGELILQNFSANALTVNSVITNNTTASSLTTGGTGTTVLTGANTYTGTTVVASGVLNIRNVASLGDAVAGTTVTNGAALEIQGGLTFASEGLTLVGSGIGNGGALRSVSGTNTYSGVITLTGDTRINADADSLTLSGGIPQPVSATVTATGGASGQATINTASTTGLALGQWVTGTNIPNGSVITAIVNNTSFTINQNLTGTASGNYAATNAPTWSGTLSLGGAGNINANAPIVGSFPLTGILKDGAGTLTMNAANAYNGATVISQGTLKLGNNAGLGTNIGKTTIMSGATLDIAGFKAGTATVGDEVIEVSGTGVGGLGAIVNTGASQSNAFSNITMLGNTTFSANNRWDVTSGTFNAGGFDITKIGIREAVIKNSAVTNPGNIIVNDGIFRLEGAGTNWNPVTTKTATVASTGNMNIWDNTGANISNLNYVLNGGTLSADSGSNVVTNLTGNVTLNNNSSINAAISAFLANTTVSLTLSGQITGVAGFTFSGKSTNGTGTLTLTNTANDYAGNTTIASSTLKVGAASVIPDGTGKGNVIINGGATQAGTLDLNGFDETINGLSGTSNTVVGEVVNNATGTARTLTVGAGNSTASFAGIIRDNTSGTGTLALTKTGSGTQTLTGGSTFSGGTLINAGTLSVNNALGSATGSGSVTVANTGTLAGSNGSGGLGSLLGTIVGPVTVQNGGRISPGNSIGTLRLTTLTLDAGGIMDLEITSTASTDRILIDGVFSLNDASIINVLPLSLITLNDGDVFNLLDWQSLAATTFDVGTNLRQSGNGGGDLFLPDISGFGSGSYGWNVASFLTNGEISVTTIVPEPSRALLLLAGLAGLMLRRRR
jgi:fibronectin-binding autotransporter adhesin